VLEELKKLGVESAEQPLPHWDIDGMAELRKQVRGIEIMADESVHGIYDAHRVIRAGAADVINIKLMKSGGIYPALKICAAAEAAGIPCMLGCMDDMKIAITAALSLFAARRNIREADLDSFHFCVDPELGMKGGFTYEGGLYTLTEKPGLGIDFDFDAL
jgi:L-alanine-DL-glutamate epimerase-like enolase superfamily enzyme